MEKLNRLGWAEGLTTVAFGFRIGIRTNAPEFLPDLLERLPPGWRASKSQNAQWLYSLFSRPSRANPDKVFHQLHTGPDLLTRGTDFPRIRDAFGTDLQVTLALGSPWRYFIHAGAVGWKGRTIILPGDAGTGKTRLTMALLQAGAALFSDEFAVLDRAGRVHPYPLPLRVKREGDLGSERIDAESIGGAPADRPLPLGLLLSTRFDPEGPGRLTKLSPGRAALEIMAHAVQARVRPNRVMEAAGRATRGALALKGRRGEAEEMVDRVLSLW
jgi:hypothetical protein